MKKIDLQQSFRHRGELLHAGIYRVPADMAEEPAAKAVADGLGVWVPDPKASKPEAKSLGGAPENKALGGQGAAPDTFPAPDPVQRVGRGNRRGNRSVSHS